MCLVISIVLMVFGINMLLAGDYLMGIGSLISALFFMTMMIRHFMRVKKERGRVHAKDCLSCNQSMPQTKDEA